MYKRMYVNVYISDLVGISRHFVCMRHMWEFYGESRTPSSWELLRRCVKSCVRPQDFTICVVCYGAENGSEPKLRARNSPIPTQPRLNSEPGPLLHGLL